MVRRDNVTEYRKIDHVEKRSGGKQVFRTVPDLGATADANRREEARELIQSVMVELPDGTLVPAYIEQHDGSFTRNPDLPPDVKDDR